MKSADVRVYVGATGTGKSHAMRADLAELVRRVPRLVVFDPENEYGDIAQRIDSLVELYKVASTAAYRVRFVPASLDRAPEQFELVCRIVWSAATEAGRSLVFVADELADVVKASDAETSPAWLVLVKRGRKHGIHVLTASQRPAGINKGLWDNASFIRCGRLNNAPSQSTMAAALAVPIASINALSGYEYIARDMNTGQLSGAVPKPEPAAAPARRGRGRPRLDRSVEKSSTRQTRSK